MIVVVVAVAVAVKRGSGFSWVFKVDYLECFVLNFFNVIHDLSLDLPPAVGSHVGDAIRRSKDSRIY